MSPTFKAWGITIFFALVGIFFALAAPRSSILVPQIVFYAVLMLNTFYSVRLYSHIQPKTISQTTIDALLVCTYTLLALSLGYAELFPFFALWIFLIATPKYVLMLGRIPYDTLLRRKILIDCTGACFCALMFTLSLSGHPLLGTWVLAGVFALANVYLLFVRPMYTLEKI